MLARNRNRVLISLFITVWTTNLACSHRDEINNPISIDKSPCITKKDSIYKNLGRYYQVSPIGIDDLKFVIEIVTDTGGICSGTIIGNCTVLTAAHCIPKKRGPKSVKVITETDIYDEVEWIEIFPYFFRPTIDDIAIIRLKHDLRNINPVPLDMEKITVGEKIIIAGFGSPPFSPPIKKIGENTVTSIGIREIRIAGKGRHLIPGDSGGPVLRKRKHIYSQIGVNVGYLKGAPPGKEESFAITIRDYMRFILDKTFDDIYFLQYDIEEYK